MIRINVRDKGDLELGDIKIQIKATSPLFTESGFPETSSFSFDLPLSACNKKILSNPNRLDTKQKFKKLQVQLYFKGMPFISGVINVESMSSKVIKCSINNAELDARKQLQALNIRDLDLATYEVNDASVTNYETAITNWQNYLNDHLQRDSAEVDHSFPMIDAPYGFDEETPASIAESNNFELQYINTCVDGSYRLELGTFSPNFPRFGTTLIPLVKFQYVLLEAFKSIGYSSITGDVLELRDLKELSIFNIQTLDQQFIPTGGVAANRMKDAYSLQDYLPNVTAYQLVKSYSDMFRIISFADKGRVTMYAVSELINTEAEDFTKYSDPDDAYVWLDAEGYALSYSSLDDELENYEEEFPAFQSGLETIKVESEHRPLRQIFKNVGYTDLIGTEYGSAVSSGAISLSNDLQAIGKYRGVLKSPLNKKSPDQHLKKLILTFYRGKKINPQGEQYPMSSHSDIIEGGTYGSTLISSQLVGERSMQWQGDKGLFNQGYKDWLNFITDAKEINKTLYLPVHKLKELMNWHKLKKTICSDRGNIEAVVKDVSFSISNSGVSASKIVFVGK